MLYNITGISGKLQSNACSVEGCKEHKTRSLLRSDDGVYLHAFEHFGESNIYGVIGTGYSKCITQCRPAGFHILGAVQHLSWIIAI